VRPVVLEHATPGADEVHATTDNALKVSLPLAEVTAAGYQAGQLVMARLAPPAPGWPQPDPGSLGQPQPIVLAGHLASTVAPVLAG
jgi:hypothetical protein